MSVSCKTSQKTKTRFSCNISNVDLLKHPRENITNHGVSLAAIDEYVRDESCNSPCTSMEMAFGHGKISLDNKKHQLKIYFPSQIKFQQSRYTYNIINFLGEIGGYVGLLLGVSVLNLDPVLDKFLRMFKLKRIARPRRSRVKKITKN